MKAIDIIDIGMVITESEKNEWIWRIVYYFLFLKYFKFQNRLNYFVGEKWRFFVSLIAVFIQRRKFCLNEIYVPE